MKRLFLMAVMVLTALTASAQNSDALTDELARSLGGLFDKEAEALRPDSVTPDGEWQKVIETPLKAQEAYKYARSVLARMVPNYQKCVKLEDEKECKIICDVAFELSGIQHTGLGNDFLTGIYEMTMTLMFKDGRYRVKVEGVTCSYLRKFMGDIIGSERGEPFRTTNINTKGGMQNDMKRKAGQFMKSFSKALATQKADDDF